MRLRRNRAFKAALSVLLGLVLVAVFADVLAPADPDLQTISERLQGPSRTHLLGTDSFGRDLLSRLLEGSQVTLGATAMALAVAVGLGVPLGLAAGESRGWLDAGLSRLGDGFLALPPLILSLSIIGSLGPGLTNAMVAVGVSLAPRFFRIAQAAARSASQEQYVEALRADGLSRGRIVWRHLLPNCAGPLLAQTSFSIGTIVSAEASLSFLGLGVQPPQASWGSMIREASDQIRTDSWGILPPMSAVVVLLITSFIVGDGLRDALGRNVDDPR